MRISTAMASFERCTMCGLPFLVREAGKRPGSAGEVELVPGQLRDLFAALAGQGQEFDNASIGTIDLPGGPL